MIAPTTRDGARELFASKLSTGFQQSFQQWHEMGVTA